MNLNDQQRRLLTRLAESNATTTELMAALEIAAADLQPIAEPLLVDGLVGTAVPTAGPGFWWITEKGRDAVRSGRR